MAIDISGPWQQQQIDQFLNDCAIPVRLSCVATDGFPRVVSLWFKYSGETLYCVTHQSSKLSGLLRQSNRVGFEVSPNTPPYCGVRGQGTALLQPLGESSLLSDLIARYVGDIETSFSRWLLARSAEEIIISVTPHRLYSWDYRQRMTKES